MINNFFSSALGAAIGGFIGVIVFFMVRLFLEWLRSRPKFIRLYLFGNDLNKGQNDETEGELMHHHGKRIDDEREYKRLKVNNPIWEWTRDRVGKGEGSSVIYGPYATDFSEPGVYSATFIIRGIGFTKPTEISNDLIILELDVNKSIPEYLTPQGKINAHFKVARRFIRVSELAAGGWCEFDLRFFYDGQGIWEYRVLAYDGNDNKADNIGKFGTDVRILFNKILIRKINKLRLPWV